MAWEGSPLKGSRLVIEAAPIVMFCTTCRRQRPVGSVQLFASAECGTFAAQILHGKDIEVAALEIEEWVQSPV
jgi:hydrogenase nickel incorporation protein HypA/HybF